MQQEPKKMINEGKLLLERENFEPFSCNIWALLSRNCNPARAFTEETEHIFRYLLEEKMFTTYHVSSLQHTHTHPE
jgi:hypothetical protein